MAFSSSYFPPQLIALLHLSLWRKSCDVFICIVAILPWPQLFLYSTLTCFIGILKPSRCCLICPKQRFMFSKGQDEFMGRCVVTPLVKMNGQEPPSPRLLWYGVERVGEEAGEILAAFELFLVCKITRWFNPLSPNSDQHQFSPDNIRTLSRDTVIRINKMITKEKMPWSLNKFSQLIL